MRVAVALFVGVASQKPLNCLLKDGGPDVLCRNGIRSMEAGSNPARHPGRPVGGRARSVVHAFQEILQIRRRMIRRNNGVVGNLFREHVLLVVEEEEISVGRRGRESVVLQTSTDTLPVFDARPRASFGRLNGDGHAKKGRRLRQTKELPRDFFQGSFYKQHEGVIRIVGKQKGSFDLTGFYRGVHGGENGEHRGTDKSGASLDFARGEAFHDTFDEGDLLGIPRQERIRKRMKGVYVPDAVIHIESDVSDPCHCKRSLGREVEIADVW